MDIGAAGLLGCDQSFEDRDLIRTRQRERCLAGNVQRRRLRARSQDLRRRTAPRQRTIGSVGELERISREKKIVGAR